MSRGCYERWRERIISACRQHAATEILSSMGSLYRVPGFSGIRQQVGKLVTLARHEWCRRHGSLEGLILPPTLSYVERLSDTAVALSVLLSKPP